jgi:nucleoside-diphosphate-sugar epimerase
MNRDEVMAAAAGADVNFHGVNPPGYRRWRELAPPMLDNTIAAAGASGARILFPGNVYNYGPDAWPVVAEDSPQHARTRKGAIRVQMEATLRQAATTGARALVLRAGDYFGPRSGSSWFGAVMVKPGQPVRSVRVPGPLGVGHAWAYLPDFAATIAILADRERALADFDSFHFGGHWLESGQAMVDAVRRVARKPELPVRKMPWPLLYVAAPFSAFVRELLEMRSLWQVPLRLDNRKLVAMLGEEPHTALDEAVRTTLVGLGCLDSAE